MAKSISTVASLQILVMLILIATFAESKLNVIKLTVYVQEYRSGPKQSIFPVAGLPNTTLNSTQFATILVSDFTVTIGPSVDSPRLGVLQGFEAVTSLDGAGNTEVVATINFTSGKFKGSNLELKGLNVQSGAVREAAIVGGTKDFRFARGYFVVDSVAVKGDLFTVKITLTIVRDIPINI